MFKNAVISTVFQVKPAELTNRSPNRNNQKLKRRFQRNRNTGIDNKSCTYGKDSCLTGKTELTAIGNSNGRITLYETVNSAKNKNRNLENSIDQFEDENHISNQDTLEMENREQK